MFVLMQPTLMCFIIFSYRSYKKTNKDNYLKKVFVFL